VVWGAPEETIGWRIGVYEIPLGAAAATVKMPLKSVLLTPKVTARKSELKSPGMSFRRIEN
jgi:hypothetical protein